MYLKNIKLINFRNYKTLDLNLDRYMNIIYGNNGEGKTNILESIYFLAMTKSYRSVIDKKLINEKEDFLYIKGNIIEKFSENTYEIGLNDNIKKLKIDNKKTNKVTEYISNINIIMFYPEDLNLIKGSPGERRRFLNSELSQLNNKYIKVLNDYNKLLKIRNSYLKKLTFEKKVDNKYLDIISEYLIQRAAEIYLARKKFIERINEYAPKIFKDIMKMEDFNIIYETNIKIENYEKEKIIETLKNEFKKNYNYDIKLGFTSVGPHKDDISFYVKEENLKTIGSQGQQRVAILSLKLAELKVFEKHKKVKPILLLDDVFSELDKQKRNSLVKYLKRKNQVIITTTDLNLVDERLVKDARKINIKQGKIIKNER